MDAYEQDRLDALQALQVLDTQREERFERVVRLAQRMFDVPMVAVNLIDETRQWSKAAVGLAGEMPRSQAFCSHTIQTPKPLVVADATKDERFSSNPLVTGDPSIRFYAGQPLNAPGGQRVGALCIIDDRPREMSQAEVDLLRDLADWVEKELASDEDLHQAGLVQRRLLPRRAPQVPGFEVAGRCRPASVVGGDFYDWYGLGEDGHQVVLADVMGKGTAAAIIAASVRAVLRGASLYNPLGTAVSRTASSLQLDLEETATFVTAFVVRISPNPASGDEPRLEYVDAGHGLAVVLGSEGSWRRLDGDNLPIGVIEDASFDALPLDLAPGETLVVASDGLLDAFDSGEQVLEQVLAAHRAATSADDLVERVSGLVDGDHLVDDVTIVAVHRLED